ncbi:MAG TPA: RDD family protein [Novosphingobium sp.]|nr:RDD family protein [Novosphingobium sp.]
MAPFAGFWLRFVAYIIDAIVLQIPLTVIGMLTGLTMGMQGAGWNGAAIGAQTSATGMGFVISVVVWWLYAALMESSSWQATLGKKALGMIVTDDAGNRLSFARATGRHFSHYVSAFILGIGFLMVGWTQRKQGLHDMMAGTLVYRARSGAEVTTNAAVFE